MLIFVFFCRNSNALEDEKQSMRKAYLFVRKTASQMTQIFRSHSEVPIIEPYDSVQVLTQKMELKVIPFNTMQQFLFNDDDISINSLGWAEAKKINPAIEEPF